MSRPVATVATEAAFVGASTFVVSWALYALMKDPQSLTVSDRVWQRMALAWFLVGAIVHVVYEALGWNEAWCARGFSGPMSGFAGSFA